MPSDTHELFRGLKIVKHSLHFNAIASLSISVYTLNGKAKVLGGTTVNHSTPVIPTWTVNVLREEGFVIKYSSVYY